MLSEEAWNTSMRHGESSLPIWRTWRKFEARRSSGQGQRRRRAQAYYRQFCSALRHDEYLDTFNRPTYIWSTRKWAGLDEFTGERSVWRKYEVDCIIFATAFEVGTDYLRRAGYSIVGVEVFNRVAEMVRWLGHLPWDACERFKLFSSPRSPDSRQPIRSRLAENSTLLIRGKREGKARVE